MVEMVYNNENDYHYHYKVKHESPHPPVESAA